MGHIDPDAPVPANTFTSFATGITSGSGVDIKVGPDGNLYYLVRGGGGIVRRVIYTPPIPIASRFDTDAMNSNESTAASTVTANTEGHSQPIVVDPFATELTSATNSIQTDGATQSSATVVRRIARLEAPNRSASIAFDARSTEEDTKNSEGFFVSPFVPLW